MVMTDTLPTEASDAPITQAEIIELFGEAMPIEAVRLVFEAPPGKTLRELRRELREIAASRPTPKIESEVERVADLEAQLKVAERAINLCTGPCGAAYREAAFAAIGGVCPESSYEIPQGEALKWRLMLNLAKAHDRKTGIDTGGAHLALRAGSGPATDYWTALARTAMRTLKPRTGLVSEEMVGALKEAKVQVEVAAGKSRAFRPSYEQTLARIDAILKALETQR